MIRQRSAAFLLCAALFVGLQGCGSISNLTEGPWKTRKSGPTVPFGGVSLDFHCLASPFVAQRAQDSMLLNIVYVLGGLGDLPLSFAVDLITLPYTIPKSLSTTDTPKAPDPAR